MPAAGIGDLMDVDDAGNGRIAVSKQEGDLVTALAGQPRAGCDRVTERVHRRHGAGRYVGGPAVTGLLAQDGERRPAVLVCGALLCLAKRAGDVPLGQGAP